MIIGIPKEIKKEEYRVSVTPFGVSVKPGEVQQAINGRCRPTLRMTN